MIVVLLLFSLDALGCTYGSPVPSVCDNYKASSKVVVGKIESVSNSIYTQRVRVSVSKTYKGQERKSIELLEPRSTCDLDFSEFLNKTMLLYIQEDKLTGTLTSVSDAFNSFVERRRGDIYWLDGLPGSLERTYLYGSVELYQEEPFQFLRNVGGNRLRIYNQENSFDIKTDKQGVYKVWDIPIGKYKVEPYFGSALMKGLRLEHGKIDFGPTKNDSYDPKKARVEILSKGCGGMDYVVYESKKESK